jgi:hypothetical protein
VTVERRNWNGHCSIISSQNANSVCVSYCRQTHTRCTPGDDKTARSEHRWGTCAARERIVQSTLRKRRRPLVLTVPHKCVPLNA